MSVTKTMVHRLTPSCQIIHGPGTVLVFFGGWWWVVTGEGKVEGGRSLGFFVEPGGRCSLRNAVGPGPLVGGSGPTVWCVLGGVLLSRTLAGAVPSALSGLASGFGMGAGRYPCRCDHRDDCAGSARITR